jgi:hypothetical protein
VKIWFQNRRNKWKRQIAADNEASNLRTFSGIPLFLQSTANLHAAAAAAVANGNSFGSVSQNFNSNEKISDQFPPHNDKK